MSDPEVIYLQPECCADPATGRLWCEDPDPEDCDEAREWTKYVLANDQSRMDQIAHNLAYSTARSDIECCCIPRTIDNKFWWDTDPTHCASEDKEDIACAVEYLEARNLIERDKNNPHIVFIKDLETP